SHCHRTSLSTLVSMWDFHHRLLTKTTHELASEIAQASGVIIGLGKAAFYTQIDLDQPKAYAYAKEVMSMNALAADAQEGMTAFLEKRAPCWTAR
ncbi:MAG: hypothetical protein O2968_15850, partial [Acidobacteria bacterium]|nr:hypothetical protein [Acidobacteriota bacterium]